MKPHRFLMRLDAAELSPPFGYVRKIAPGLIEATGPAESLGDLCEIQCDGEGATLLAEVTVVDDQGIVLVPLEQQTAIPLGAKVVASRMGARAPVGDCFAGRAIDALGRPIDGGSPIVSDEYLCLSGNVPTPLERTDPRLILTTGVRAIDGALTLAQGQRVGVFAASGVGKTCLLEQLAAQTECDRCVICLVGERGREVEAIWRTLSSRGDAYRYTLVAATSNESAAMRARSVGQAMCIAEHWRSRGEHVLLMTDSMTRVAMALREIGLAAGAPPTVRAYTPNVFAVLPQLVERCGALASGGAITAVMTVLSETDDVDDPIVELMKSLLDGHIILSRSLAEQGHFPAIDIVRSVSRGAERLVAPDHASAMRRAISLLGSYEDARVMIESGVYRPGTNPDVDCAVVARPELTAFLRQPAGETAVFGETVRRLRTIGENAAGHA